MFHKRYRRRERSVEEAIIEMYLTGVSVRRVDDIKEAAKKVDDGIEEYLVVKNQMFHSVTTKKYKQEHLKCMCANGI